MRRLLLLSLPIALLAWVALPANADVIRCTSAAGKVSYTDGACPSGAKDVRQVEILQPPTPTAEEIEARQLAAQDARAERAYRAQREADVAAARAVPQPSSGPAVMDPRAGTNSFGDGSTQIASDGGYGYGYDYGGSYGYGGGYRQPPTSLAPPIRKCDAKGCLDTMGNRYDNTGQLTSYRNIKGQSCRPVGTTVICR